MFNGPGSTTRPQTSKITATRLAEMVWCNIISVLTPEYLLPSQWFRSSLLLIYFLDGPYRCSHCTKVWHKTYWIYDGPLSRSARRRRDFCDGWTTLHNLYSVCVNNSLNRYGLGPAQKLSGSIVWTPIRNVTLQFRERRGAASPCYGNRAENTGLIYEQKPCDPVWFSRRRKSYPVV